MEERSAVDAAEASEVMASMDCITILGSFDSKPAWNKRIMHGCPSSRQIEGLPAVACPTLAAAIDAAPVEHLQLRGLLATRQP